MKLAMKYFKNQMNCPEPIPPTDVVCNYKNGFMLIQELACYMHFMEISSDYPGNIKFEEIIYDRIMPGFNHCFVALNTINNIRKKITCINTRRNASELVVLTFVTFSNNWNNK